MKPISSLDPPRSPWPRRMRRFAQRLLALAAFGLAAFLAYTFVAAPLLEGDEEDVAAPAMEAPAEQEPAPEPPPRPASAPQVIPDWAWALNEWHSTSGAERGERPAEAPRPVPDWYWEWREWRQEQAALAEESG